MLAYYWLLGIPLLLEVIVLFNTEHSLNMEKKIKSEKKIIAVFFFIFFLLLAFRDINIGIDLHSYRYYFLNMKTIGWDSVFDATMEPLYNVLNKIISSIGGDFQFFLVVVAFITVLPFAILYYKESENAMLTISIFI